MHIQLTIQSSLLCVVALAAAMRKAYALPVPCHTTVQGSDTHNQCTNIYTDYIEPHCGPQIIQQPVWLGGLS